MVTRSKINQLKRLLEQISPKERPTVTIAKETLERHGIIHSTEFMRLGYETENGEIVYLPDKEYEN